MNIKVITDAIQTYSSIQKDLENFLGKVISGSETAAEETITAIKARITNIRDFLVPELKKAEATAVAIDAAAVSAANSGKTVKKIVAVTAPTKVS